MTLEAIQANLQNYSDEASLLAALTEARATNSDKKMFDKQASVLLKQFKQHLKNEKQREMQQKIEAYGGIVECDYPWEDNDPYICMGFTVNNDGVFTIDKDLRTVQIVSTPILPVMTTQEESNLECYTKYAIRTKQGWRYKTIPQKDVSSKRGVLDALSGCLDGLTDATADYFVNYLSEIKRYNMDKIKVMHGTTHLGWQNKKTFVPYADGFLYTGLMANSDIEAYETHGNEQTQLDFFRRIWTNSCKEIRIMLAASLASADNTGNLSFWTHIFGFTGTGKSALLTMCASIWGNPAATIRTFNSTDVAQENVAAMLHDIPLFLDEAQTSGKYDDISKTIYKNTEGRGKSRGQRQGGNRQTGTWNSLIVSTGESQLLDTEGSQGGGAFNRLINLNIQGRTLFDNFSELFDICNGNYGFIGKRFVETLIALEEKNPGAYSQIVDSFSKDVLHVTNSNVSGKQAKNAARLMAAATVLSKILGVKNPLTVEDVASVLTTNSELDVNARCYARVVTMFAENRIKFKGTEEHDNATNNVGLWGNFYGSENVLRFPTNGEFAQKIKDEGFSMTQFVQAAAAKNIAEKDSNGKFSKPIRVGGSLVRVYSIKLECDWQSGLIQTEQAATDLPF